MKQTFPERVKNVILDSFNYAGLSPEEASLFYDKLVEEICNNPNVGVSIADEEIIELVTGMIE